MSAAPSFADRLLTKGLLETPVLLLTQPHCAGAERGASRDQTELRPVRVSREMSSAGRGGAWGGEGPQGHKVTELGRQRARFREPRKNAGVTLRKQGAAEGVEKVIWRLRREHQDRLWNRR